MGACYQESTEGRAPFIRSLARCEGRWLVAVFSAALLAVATLTAAPGLTAVTPASAASCANPVACENQLPGTPESVWQVPQGDGSTIQGFADPFSVNVGNSVNFKIQSAASAYVIDIYRMGYYGGDGARLVTTITPNITVSQNQPACNTNTATGLVDCGNWSVSATWNVPADAVSGVYQADLVRTDGISDMNQILFVVTNNASTSDIVYMTSDETWQAYNNWGGYSLYTGTASNTASSPQVPGRAQEVSYNRPLSNTVSGADGITVPASQDFYYWDYPMIRFMEENGYDVSYVSQANVAASGGAAMLEQHKLFMTVGHSEYWDAGDRANVTAARNSGVNLAFFSGNTMWWKTRWLPSAVTGENYDTLVCYKESLDSAQTDPADPPTWTGSWRDPRFSPPTDGGQPENALTGQLWMVNATSNSSYPIQVPYAYSKLQIWRNTSVASLQPGQTASMTANTLGGEWDVDVDNGFRPAGEIDMSQNTESVSQVLTTPNQNFAPGTQTNSLTLYRAASGALVFDAGTENWSWGLDADHEGNPDGPASTDMQQMTVNLFADMGAQPTTLESGLVQAAAPNDTAPPTSTITSPSAGATLSNGSQITISGTATDSGGGVVAGVEVSTDGGQTWHPVTTMSPADTTVNWSYTWSVAGSGPVTIMSRATDDDGNTETPGPGVTITVNCPCSLFGNNYTPVVTSAGDSSPYELGMKFQSNVAGWVAGVRFYKGAGNNGTHTGSLWTSSGTLLATGTFTNETASGWQTMTFTNPVQIAANTTYVVSYYDPNGHYAADQDLFDWPLNTPPLTALKANYLTAGAGNGVYHVGGPGFPTQMFMGTSYAVDVIFDTTQPPGAPPSVTSASPYPGSSSNPVSVTPQATFSEPVTPSTVSFTLADPKGNSIAGSTSFNSADTIATFTPGSSLTPNTTYTVTISGAQDQFSQTMTPDTYTFTTSKTFNTGGQCPCTIWPDSTPQNASTATDTSPVVVGMKFQANANGTITGIRFYKEPNNTGAHTGTLWTASGSVLATGTFTTESTEGWQELDFSTPVSVTAGTTYVASYSTSTGHYAATTSGLASAVTNGPLTALANGGVYAYGTSTTFPTSTYQASNYWVDVVYSPTSPSVTSTNLVNGQTSVPTNTSVSFTFSTAMQPSTIQFSLTGPGGASVPGSLSYNSSTNTATFTPSSTLVNVTNYNATVSGAQSTFGSSMSGPYSWSFTTAQPTPQSGQCPCSIWPDSTLPATPDVNDPSAVNLGVKFTASQNGWITGIRFYKGVANIGTHVGSLYTANGALLGQVTFTNESAAGWQQANFSTPIAITTGTTYVASYFAPKGEYAGALSAFNSAVTNSPLTALQSSTSGGNGLYKYASSSAFPNSSYNASNYWVDVVFTTTAP